MNNNEIVQLKSYDDRTGQEIGNVLPITNSEAVKVKNNKKLTEILTELDNKIEQTNASLDNKANKNEVVQKGYGKLNDFDEETRAEILGLSEGETNINAVLGEENVRLGNISNKTVSVEKTTFITPESRNVLSGAFKTGFMDTIKNTWRDDRTDRFSTREIISLNDANIIYTNAYTIYFYDENNNFLSETNVYPLKLTVPSGATGFRPNFKYEKTSYENAYVRFNSDSSKFYAEDLIVRSDNLILDSKCIENKSLMCLEKTDNIYAVNVISELTIKEKGFFHPSDNNWRDRADLFTVQELYKVIYNKTYSFNAYSLYVYDINGVNIGTITSNLNTWICDDKRYAYVRPNYRYVKTSVEDAYFKIMDYKYKFDDSIEISNNSNSNNNNVSNPKFMHISMDDVINAFADINTNNYSSIFKNNMFKFLKEMHEQYGMVFSGYCFYQTKDLSFNLSMFSDKYKNEFKDNASWLKFGVHYLDDNGGSFGTVDSETGLQYYQNIITELFRITGSFESIDTVPRLHNYLGTLEFMQKVKSINLGIQGLLSPETNRTCYYLNSANKDYLLTHDNLIDYTNNLKFFSTDIRLEKCDDIIVELNNRLANIEYSSRMKELVIFTHEKYFNDIMQTKIENCCKFAKENNYTFDFPMNHI